MANDSLECAIIYSRTSAGQRRKASETAKRNGEALHLIANNRGQQKEHAAAQEEKSSQDNYSAITTSNN